MTMQQVRMPGNEMNVLMSHNMRLMYKMGNGSQDAALSPQSWPRPGKTNWEEKFVRKNPDSLTCFFVV